MLKEDLVHIVLSQKDYYFSGSEYIPRELSSRLNWSNSNVTILSGVRRSGKSTLMRQSIIETGLNAGYLHFDDPRLKNFSVLDFYKLEEIWHDKEIYQFDEIHRVDEWESYIRQANERRKKIGITGSNAQLMSKELGTLLTGRHLTYELFPFSYKEFLQIENNPPGLGPWKKYLQFGGFPDAIKNNEVQYHVDLFNDILLKDIMVRHKIRNQQDLVTVALHMITNIARPFTHTKLASNYGIKSVKTVIDFIGYLEDVYLLFIVPKYSTSYKQQINNPKKIFIVDHALAKNNSTQSQADLGRQLENMVFMELRRKTKDIYYFQDTSECDFVVVERNIGKSCIQVSQHIGEENYKREVTGLITALNHFDLPEGIIVTMDQEDVITEQNKTIQLIPFWKWAS